MDLTNNKIENINIELNKLSQEGKIDISKISDGYHTFDELYKHRCLLFALICNQNKHIAWKSKLHFDGSMFDDYFIVGIKTQYGNISYHYHINNWDLFKIAELANAPEYKGEINERIISQCIMTGDL